MFKRFLFCLTVLSVFFMSLNVYAFAHKLRSDWYDEDVAGTKKEKVTSITFSEETFDKLHAHRLYWELDKYGLVAYMDTDTDVVIAIPEGDTLETGFNANDIFAFYKIHYIDKEHYETGDNGVKIYGVQPDDGSIPVDDFTKYESDLESINNLYLLDTYPTENFDEFFMGLKNLSTIDVSNMKTSFAKSFARMFMGCENLKSINISNFNTDNIVDMSNMFKNCTSLEYVFIDKLDTSEVRDTASMFDNCQKLKGVDISHFNTKSLNKCSGMFIDCASLEAVDLSNFNLTGNVDVENMLVGCDSLKAILISDSICQRFNNMRLEGKWKNVTTNVVYDFDNALNLKPTAGGYVKIQ